MVPAFSTSCCSMIERWQKIVKLQGSCELDVASEFTVLTGDIIATTAFGSSYQEGKKIFKLQEELAILVYEALNSIYIPYFRYKSYNLFISRILLIGLAIASPCTKTHFRRRVTENSEHSNSKGQP